MLTKETITANESLKGLSEEQITAITTLSANDEASVLGEKFGRVYREMDASIEEATGIKRIGDEKTYVYLKRAATEYAAKYKDYDTLKSTIADLEEKVKKGGDEAIKSQLEQAQKELDATKAQFNTLKADFDKKEGEHKKALLDYKIDSEIAKAMEGMKFKATFNEGVLSTLKAKAIDTIKSKNPAFETRDGRERLIFHDENGAPLNNAENQLNPFTAKELLTKEFEAMDLLEKTPAKGAGGTGPKPKGNGTHLGATTKEEAMTIIGKMLSEKGISNTDLRYQEAFDKLWEDNDIDSLPLTK